jgi:cobalt-zinc-cadmium efflux system membrane fusion protein
MYCLKIRFRLALAILSMAGLAGLRAEPAGTNAPPASGTASNLTVELSSNQLNSIKIGPAETYRFPVEKEAVGTISFDEDPAIVQAESTLLSAAATAQVTSNELARARALYETNGVAQRELDQAVSDEETAEAALKAARAAVRVLGKTDEDIDRMIAAGAIGAPGPAPAKWLLANVSESDSPLVQTGQPVRIKVIAFPDRAFAGKISKIYGTVDPNLHHLPVRCEVEDPDNVLRPGMLADAFIEVADPVESIAVPANSVVREGDGTMTAWVTTDRRHFTQQVIKAGLREDGVVQILDGLGSGQLVVTDGAIFLDNMVNAVPSD